MASKRALILEYLRTTVLPLVQTSGGYNYTLKVIRRGLQHPTDLNDSQFPAVFISASSEGRQNKTLGHPIFVASLSVALVGYVKNSKPNPNASGPGVQQDLDRLIEDVTKAVYADPTQGGLVHRTEVQRVDTDDGDLDPYAACVVTANFDYNSEGTTP